MNIRLPARTAETKPSTPLIIALCVLIGIAVGFASFLVNPLYLIAGVIVIPVGWWFVRSVPRAVLALVLVIGLLPRFTSPARLGGFTPTLLDLALIGLLVVWFVKGRSAQVQGQAAQGQALPLQRIAIGVPLLCLVVVAITTFIVGLPNGALTPLVIRRFAEMVLSLLMVWVLVAVLSAQTEQDRFVRLILLVGGASAFIGVALYITPDELAMRLLSALRPFGYPEGPSVLRFIRDDPALSQRATGLWIDPNAFGGYLLITGAISLPQLFAHKPVVRHVWVAVCLGLIGLALVLTVSRGAMLGLALSGFLIGVLRYRKLLLLGIVLIALLLVLPQTRDLISHFAAGFAGQDLATQMRFGEYKDALRLIERYPLLGVGFIDAPDTDLYIGVSSMYLLIAQQMGILGAVAFAAVMVALFANAVRAWPQVRTDDARAAIFLGAHAAIVGAMFSGIFDHYFFNIDFHVSVMLFWSAVALACAAQTGHRPVST
jgi:O-antigen ligase